jgi:hypothetical protein
MQELHTCCSFITRVIENFSTHGSVLAMNERCKRLFGGGTRIDSYSMSSGRGNVPSSKSDMTIVLPASACDSSPKPALPLDNSGLQFNLLSNQPGIQVRRCWSPTMGKLGAVYVAKMLVRGSRGKL